VGELGKRWGCEEERRKIGKIGGEVKSSRGCVRKDKKNKGERGGEEG